LRQHLAHGLLPGFGLQANVEKTRPGDLDGRHPFLKGGCALQRGFDLLAQRARIGLERLGQLHRGGAGQVAMRRLFGRFKRGLLPRAGRNLLQRRGQGSEQFLFHGKHGADILGNSSKKNLREPANFGLVRSSTPRFSALK